MIGSAPLWQRNYYERIVRNDHELNRIRDYIALNPAFWSHDWENIDRIADNDYEIQWAWLEESNAGVQLNRI